MKKILNLKALLVVMVLGVATFGGVKAYNHMAGVSGITSLLLKNAEALAQEESGSEGLTIFCDKSKTAYNCYYRCAGCNRLVEDTDGEFVGAVGKCNRCGRPANP